MVTCNNAYLLLEVKPTEKKTKKQNWDTKLSFLPFSQVWIIIFSFLRYFNFKTSFKLRCCHAQDLFGSQIPVTTGGFEL